MDRPSTHLIERQANRASRAFILVQLTSLGNPWRPLAITWLPTRRSHDPKMVIGTISSTTAELRTPKMAGKTLISHQEVTWTTSTASTRAPAKSYLASWRLRMSPTTTATSNWVDIQSILLHLSLSRPTRISRLIHPMKLGRNLFVRLLEDQQIIVSARAVAEDLNKEKAMGNFHFTRDCRRIERSLAAWFRTNNCNQWINARTRIVFRVQLICIRHHLAPRNIYLRPLHVHHSR